MPLSRRSLVLIWALRKVKATEKINVRSDFATVDWCNLKASWEEHALSQFKKNTTYSPLRPREATRSMVSLQSWVFENNWAKGWPH